MLVLPLVLALPLLLGGVSGTLGVSALLVLLDPLSLSARVSRSIPLTLLLPNTGALTDWKGKRAWCDEQLLATGFRRELLLPLETAGLKALIR
jgi:hypothetical protein